MVAQQLTASAARKLPNWLPPIGIPLQSTALGSKGQHRLSQAIFEAPVAPPKSRYAFKMLDVSPWRPEYPSSRTTGGTVYILIITAQDRH